MGGGGNFLKVSDLGTVEDSGKSPEDFFQSVTVGTTTTGQPGTPANVSNSGSGANAVLDFVIPAGMDGHNPNLGTYKIDNGTIVNKPTTGIAGDYIVVVDETQNPVTAIVYLWDTSQSDFVSTGRDANDAQSQE